MAAVQAGMDTGNKAEAFPVRGPNYQSPFPFAHARQHLFYQFVWFGVTQLVANASRSSSSRTVASSQFSFFTCFNVEKLN